MNERRKHPLHQSRLYKLTSPTKLAEVLQLTSDKTEKLLAASENYIRFKSGKRDIEWPKPLLRAAHKRAAILLSRIETPEFLHSATRGRSYISNAKQHSAELPTVKVDLRQFYQSVRAQAVFHFFKDTMQCASDAAAILTKLLTVDGHLPTGSSASPILSYFTYKDMFQELNELATGRDCVMTCYVDDMSFTGKAASGALLYDARKIIGRYRLRAHKTKVFRAGQPRVITGVAITRLGMRLPNRRQKAIADDLAALSRPMTQDKREAIVRRVKGRMYEAAQIEPGWRKRAEELIVPSAETGGTK